MTVSSGLLYLIESRHPEFDTLRASSIPMEPEAPKSCCTIPLHGEHRPAQPVSRSAPGQDSEASCRTQEPAPPRVRKVRHAMSPAGVGGSASSAMLEGAQDGESLLE